MKNYLMPVFVVTGYLFIYWFAIQLELNIQLILFMFSISPMLLLWMVYKVLTDDDPVPNTFDEKWYEDGEERKQ